MRSNEQLVAELREAPDSWVDAAIVVAFDCRFEFVAEDHPDPLSRLNSLQEQGGLAIGLAGVQPARPKEDAFHTQVFQEFASQAWAGRYMDTLRGIVRHHASFQEAAGFMGLHISRSA